jgi:hypothetical protein
MTAQQVPVCEACGVPLQTAEDHGGGDTSNPRCRYCTNPAGSRNLHLETEETE